MRPNSPPRFSERSWLTEYATFTSAAAVLLFFTALEADWLVLDVVGIHGAAGLILAYRLFTVLFTAAEWTGLSIPVLMVVQRLSWLRREPSPEPIGQRVSPGLDDGVGLDVIGDGVLQMGEVGIPDYVEEERKE